LKDKPCSMIAGTGSAVPEKVLTNFDLEKIVDTSDEWIRTRTGIERRHFLEKGKANSDLATLAATACSGFLYGINLADSLINNGQYKNILVIGSEVLSRFIDWEDRATCVLFGDGAGAAVLVPSDGHKGLLSTYMKSDGRLNKLLNLPGGGSLHPATKETIDQRLHYIKMEGREVFKHAVRTMVDAAEQGLKKAGIKPDEIDLLINHQANVRIIDAVAHRMKLPNEKVFINLNEYGNTSAASIPIALDQARKEKVLNEGDLCLLVAFGGGFTWASSVIKF